VEDDAREGGGDEAAPSGGGARRRSRKGVETPQEVWDKIPDHRYRGEP
jgi:hypothetical protein